ncbi:unnamed protein product, partial [Oncorhynchus mykiss]
LSDRTIPSLPSLTPLLWSNGLLQDKDFGKQTLHKGHANPLAEVTTSLKTYQHFTLEKAYLGEDFFWAFTPVAGDFIRIRFFTPVRIERYFFRSGNIEHPGDKLFNTSVEVLPFDVSLATIHPIHSQYIISYPTCSILIRSAPL